MWTVFSISAAYSYLAAIVGRHKLSYLAHIKCDVTTTPHLESQLSTLQSQPHTSLPSTDPINSYSCCSSVVTDSESATESADSS